MRSLKQTTIMEEHSTSLASLATNVSYSRSRLFMTVTADQERQSHRKSLRSSSEFLSRMGSLYPNNHEGAMRQDIKDILKSWSDDGLSKSIAGYSRQKIIWRLQQEHAVGKSQEYNAIQNENDDREPTFDMTNKKSGYTVSSTSRQRQMSTQQAELYLKQCKSSILFL